MKKILRIDNPNVYAEYVGAPMLHPQFPKYLSYGTKSIIVGEGSRVMPPVTVVRGCSVKIGKNVVVMNNALFMGAGGITIEDNTVVAGNPARLIKRIGAIS